MKGLSNCGLQAKSCLLPVYIKFFFFLNTDMTIYLCYL